MNSKLPIIFFGSSQFVLPIIEFLNRDYDLKLVVTTEKNPEDAVPKYCSDNNITFISIQSFKEPIWQEWKLEIENWKLEIAVLAYFGLIIPQNLIDLFPKGIINIHPSRLPQYRGTTPGQTPIVLGDVRTGVSIMLLDREVDHGPILAIEDEKILTADTSTTLYKRLFSKGVELLEAVLPAYLSGQLKATEQDHKKATYTKPLTRKSGYIDCTKPISPVLLDRLIRAYHPWPGVWTLAKINNQEVRIKFLPNKILQVEGKKPVKYKDFINGYPEGKEILEKLQLI